MKEYHYELRTLTLLINFELGNFELLEFSVRSTHKLLYRNKKLFKAESLILDFIRKILKENPDQYQNKKIFQNLKKDFEKILDDPMERKILEDFDYVSWIESKITGKTFTETVREKSGNWEPA